MGLLTESRLDEIVQASCPACGAGPLSFRAFLDGRILLFGGEPVSKLTWCYDGEKFVDGVYEIRCAGCSGTLFLAAVCPRCNTADGLARALATENRFPLPKECPQCSGEELQYTALLPATVACERKRAAAPRPQVDPYEPGFHGYKVTCTDCGEVATHSASCPLCEAPGPLRARPG
jgi:hypothetical protein